MDGWVCEKNNATAVMEIVKEGFVLCRVVSCVVSCVCCKGLMQSPG